VSPEGAQPQGAAPPQDPKFLPTPALLASVPETHAPGGAETAGGRHRGPPQHQQEDGANRSSSSGAAPEVKGEDLIGFNEPFEQTCAGVKEAFGPMIASSLQSSKWEKRAEALKAISVIMRGLPAPGAEPAGACRKKESRSRDPAECWRLSCQLLNHALHDKVMPVRFAALDLFVDTFFRTEGVAKQEHAQRALDVLFTGLIGKLGDTNVRLHEHIQKCVLFCAEDQALFGLDLVLARLRKRLVATPGRSGERMNFGILDTTSFLLQHFPGRRASKHDDEDDDDEVGASKKDSWTQHDIGPFIVAGMDDSQGARVRTSAVSLAVVVYQTFGMEAMMPLLAGLRPAKQTLLKQAFAEWESNDEELDDGGPEEDGETWTADLAGLVIQGNAIKPSACARPQLPGLAIPASEEESLMDGILEEAGMVFNGTGIINEGKAARKNSCMYLDLDELEFSVNGVHDDPLSLRSTSIEVC